MSKIIIHPLGIDQLEELFLKHPKDSSKCCFFFDKKDQRIFELSYKKNDYHSWLTSNRLFKDGNIYSFTQIDPLFLLVPYLYKSSDKFQNLGDIFMDNELPFELQCLFSENIVKCIAETKTFEDDIFVKFNHERCFRWLKLKFDKLKTALKAMGYGKKLFGYQLPNCSALDSSFTEDEVKIFAFELLSDYLPIEIADKLRTQLSIIDSSELQQTLMSDKSNTALKAQRQNKRSFEEEENMEYSNKQNDSTTSNKKPKMTRTERILLKSDKSGMKSISSFFAKRK